VCVFPSYAPVTVVATTLFPCLLRHSHTGTHTHTCQPFPVPPSLFLLLLLWMLRLCHIILSNIPDFSDITQVPLLGDMHS
jgi:hypothetical protein